MYVSSHCRVVAISARDYLCASRATRPAISSTKEQLSKNTYSEFAYGNMRPNMPALVMNKMTVGGVSNGTRFYGWIKICTDILRQTNVRKVGFHILCGGN